MKNRKKAGGAPTDRDPTSNPQHSGDASPGSEIDEMALRAPKSQWNETDAPAAGDRMTDDERRGHDLLGQSGVRDDAIPGVSGLNENPVNSDVAGSAGGERRNPPLVEDAGIGDGGISMSGGRAGGARGHGGRSDRGAGSPTGEGEAGPGEYKSTSRFDLDHPSSDIGDEREGG